MSLLTRLGRMEGTNKQVMIFASREESQDTAEEVSYQTLKLLILEDSEAVSLNYGRINNSRKLDFIVFSLDYYCLFYLYHVRLSTEISVIARSSSVRRSAFEELSSLLVRYSMLMHCSRYPSERYFTELYAFDRTNVLFLG